MMAPTLAAPLLLPIVALRALHLYTSLLKRRTPLDVVLAPSLA
ncbi:hypothetical protein BH11ARM1_BH11ARM1_17630 [soil metagenome]